MVLYEGGYIVTADHVIGPAKTARVRLGDGTILPADIVARDRRSDLALLQVKGKLTPISQGETPALAAPVCGLVNQFGFGIQVTCGVVSAHVTRNLGFATMEDLIQTDATANPGSSGGALVDKSGKLVGIFIGIYQKDGQGQLGMNYAQSLRVVLRVTGDMLKHGKVIYGYAGMQVQDLSRTEQITLSGVRVVDIDSEGPAAAAGVLKQDILVAIDGRPVRRQAEAFTALHLKKPGEAVVLTVEREGQRQKIEVTLKK